MGPPKTPDKIKPAQFSKFLPEYVDYAERIRKTLYYGKLPATDRPSLPFTGMSVEKIGKLCRKDGLDRLDMRYASSVCYDACVTPCSLVLALMYIDRLRASNPEYLASVSPSQVFIVSLLVASKYLYDDGEEDEVFNDEWATSAAVPLADLNQAEREFLVAIEWNLFVDADTFLNALKALENDIALREGSKRGYFTYTDLISILQLVPSSCTVLSLVSQMFAVCIVGYTVAVVSVIAGTLIAQECSQQLTTAMKQLTSDVSVTEDNSSVPASVTHDVLLPTSSHLVNPPQLLTVEVDDIDSDTEEVSVGLPGLPSHALTTLTTSILLAISSGIPHHRSNQGRKKKCISCRPSSVNDEKEFNSSDDIFAMLDFDSDVGEFDPTDNRLAFTTGAFWPPSSYKFGSLGINSFDLTIDITDANVRLQKDDWVYSNPWVMPWLSWHVSPVYGLIHNFSGIGAPNIGRTNGGMDYSMSEWLAWVNGMFVDVFDFTPEPEILIPRSHLFSRVAMAVSK